MPALVGHHRPYSPAMQAAKHGVVKGTLGRLVAIHTTTLFHKPQHYFEAAWRRGATGGPILINLVHDIDNLRALAGKIVAAQAVSTNATRGLQAEDTAAAILECASGSLATMLLSGTTVASASWEHTSGENPRLAATPPRIASSSPAHTAPSPCPTCVFGTSREALPGPPPG